MTYLQRAFILLLVCCLLLCTASCGVLPENGAVEPTPGASAAAPVDDDEVIPTPQAVSGVYTLNLAMDTLPLCWNPHMWESAADALIWSATASPLLDLSYETGADGVEHAVWLFEMAESVEDITGSFSGGEAWGIQSGETGRVWRIRLNPDACWNDEARTPITADTYLYSMRALLDSQMQNYRAVDFRSGRAALAGAESYYHAGTDGWQENDSAQGAVYPYSEWVFAEDGGCTAADGTALCFSLNQPLSYWLDGHSIADYVQAGYMPQEIYDSLMALADENGYVPVTQESADLLYSFTGSEDWGAESRDRLASYVVFRRSWPAVEWDSVGLLKEDDHTLLYICAESTDEFDLRYALTTPFLVYEPLYEAGKFTYEGRVYTDYGSSPETSMSCGPYALSSVTGTLFTLDRNHSWFGYADGKHVDQYQTDRILLRIQNAEKAVDRFAAGEVDLLSSDRLTDGLLMADGSICHFFLMTDYAELAELQAAAGSNVNKTCLSNAAFRRGFSLALDRAAFAAADDNCRAALGLISDISYDCVSQLSRYRGTEEAMRAVCSAYGVEIAEGSSVSAAYQACTGRNPALARHLFQLAWEQMTEDGSWEDGMTIVLDCAVSDAEITDALRRQNAILQQNLNEAAEGTGFEGKITVNFLAMPDRYSAAANGQIEMGYGAWGAAAFDPYSLLRCYCDPSYAAIHEYQGFQPDTRLMTMLVDEELETHTYTEWCRMIQDGGSCADRPALRRQILTRLEAGLLMEYRSIPVCEYGRSVLLSDRLVPGTTEYDILYSFGGLRSLRFTCDDAQWASLCAAD